MIRLNVDISAIKARTIMKALRSVLLASAVLTVVCGVMFAQNATVPPDSTRALVQAKTTYLVSGHVKYFKTKGFKTPGGRLAL